ncbi:putative JmjC domain, methyltransferase Ppm1/Ppm2/Tcmp, kelch-type beta propeller [Septoria linicola]|nr:putative JmjC domain, methyltransferase Ppm1/Ppm2/Tcmp, kelch-type beta propeller [Septoria linicola]
MNSTTTTQAEENGSPLPDTFQPGFDTETKAVQPEQDSKLVHDAPVTEEDTSLFNSGHENRSNGKMLATEKSFRSTAMSSKVKRSVSVPLAVKTNQTTSSGQDAQKQQRDELIMDTNKSSIVSKRSVEKLYYDGEPEYFRYFVSKFKRRSPLINRGDPLPWLFLGKQPLLCQGATFVDVDYPSLMQNKIGIIQKTDQLKALLPKLTLTGKDKGLLASSDPYVAIGCDLINLDPLQEILQDHLQMGNGDVAILFTSEVSTAYMTREGSQGVFQWAATFPDVRFCLLEQHLPDGPDHPFAATMLAHFDKLRTPLRAAGTMEQMKARFVAAGFPETGTEIRSLWELWSDPTFLSAEERRRLDHVEPFDEWEEFALFGSHYFLLFAEKEPNKDYTMKPYRASRASLFAGSGRGSFSSSPTSSDSPTTPQYHFGPGDVLQTHELKEPHDFRRFGALIPPLQIDALGDSLGLHGGLGTQERVHTCNTYSRFDAVQAISGPPLRTGLMCHNVTRLGNTSNCVLTGGRTSPDKASTESWLRLDGTWRRVQDLPRGRYRHCVVPLVLPTDPRPAHTVLMFGGKTSDGQVLDEWLIWTGETGWQQVTIRGNERPPARFGAVMITDSKGGVSGVLIGGMTSAGRILNDFWHWTLEPDMTLVCKNVTAKAIAFLKADGCILGRFGAQLVRSNRGILMIGGITGARMLTRQDEILNMKTLRPQPIQGPRPLLVGHTVQDVDGGLVVLGGGATCFSFGTTWNRSCILNDAQPGKFDMEWRLHSTLESDKSATEQSNSPIAAPPSNALPNGTSSKPNQLPTPSPIFEVKISHGINFPQYISAARPIVLRKCRLGPCIATWSNSYLRDKIGSDRAVSIHSATSTPSMDFQTKNFQYITQSFGSFLSAVERGERLYLRALSKDSPSKEPTKLAEDFPSIASDFLLPDELEFVQQNAHSSPLRISGPVNMWLHYDVMANVYCQIRGRKKLVLFPPSDVSHLGFEPGASSSSVSIFSPPQSSYPSSTQSLVNLSLTNPQSTILEPGDILFIPPMWPHTTAPASSPPSRDYETSVAVNVFFRNLSPDSHAYAAGRDVYGNRDLAAYEKGRKDLAKIAKTFEGLPGDVARFYLERLGGELVGEGRRLQGKNGSGGGMGMGQVATGNSNAPAPGQGQVTRAGNEAVEVAVTGINDEQRPETRSTSASVAAPSVADSGTGSIAWSKATSERLHDIYAELGQ